MILIFEKHPPFECIYKESFALLRESNAFIRESFALIREKYFFFSTKMSSMGFRTKIRS